MGTVKETPAFRTHRTHLGLTLGPTLGFPVGSIEGLSDGPSLGPQDGISLGVRLGDADGTADRHERSYSTLPTNPCVRYRNAKGRKGYPITPSPMRTSGGRSADKESSSPPSKSSSRTVPNRSSALSRSKRTRASSSRVERSHPRVWGDRSGPELRERNLEIAPPGGERRRGEIRLADGPVRDPGPPVEVSAVIKGKRVDGAAGGPVRIGVPPLVVQGVDFVVRFPAAVGARVRPIKPGERLRSGQRREVHVKSQAGDHDSVRVAGPGPNRNKHATTAWPSTQIVGAWLLDGLDVGESDREGVPVVLRVGSYVGAVLDVGTVVLVVHPSHEPSGLVEVLGVVERIGYHAFSHLNDRFVPLIINDTIAIGRIVHSVWAYGPAVRRALRVVQVLPRFWRQYPQSVRFLKGQVERSHSSVSPGNGSGPKIVEGYPKVIRLASRGPRHQIVRPEGTPGNLFPPREIASMVPAVVERQSPRASVRPLRIGVVPLERPDLVGHNAGE
ncbi:LOW QUALITY PROTEIN: hypothetical protein ACHAWF_018225 [Thalassiosira exigua]